MNTKKWSARVSDEEAARRAAGRRHYNGVRHVRRELRRHDVAELLAAHGMGRGYQARIARTLGVHPSTVSRDVAALFAVARTGPCPLCGMDWSDPLESVSRRLLRDP